MQPHNLGHDGQTRDHYGVVVRLERVKDDLNKRIQPGHHFVLSGLRSSVVCNYLLLFQSLLQALKSKLSQNPAADFFRLLAVNRLVALQPQHFHFHIHLIPRYENDGMKLSTVNNYGKFDNEYFNSLVNSIKKEL